MSQYFNPIKEFGPLCICPTTGLESLSHMSHNVWIVITIYTINYWVAYDGCIATIDREWSKKLEGAINISNSVNCCLWLESQMK